MLFVQQVVILPELQWFCSKTVEVESEITDPQAPKQLKAYAEEVGQSYEEIAEEFMRRRAKIQICFASTQFQPTPDENKDLVMMNLDGVVVVKG